MKLSHSIGLLKDLFICTAYFSTEGATWYKREEALQQFDALLHDIAQIQVMKGTVLLSGDFNARTGTLADFIPQEDLTDVLPQELNFSEHLPANITQRCSADTESLNNFGHNLLALCQDTNLLILNGRVVGDESGCLTCFKDNGASLVDYFVPSILQLNPCLRVQCRQPDSDHTPLTLSIPLSQPVNRNKPQSTQTMRNPTRLNACLTESSDIDQLLQAA